MQLLSFTIAVLRSDGGFLSLRLHSRTLVFGADPAADANCLDFLSQHRDGRVVQAIDALRLDLNEIHGNLRLSPTQAEQLLIEARQGLKLSSALGDRPCELTLALLDTLAQHG